MLTAEKPIDRPSMTGHSAIASMISDLGKHEETRSLSLDRYAEAVGAAAAGDTEAVRRWIEAVR